MMKRRRMASIGSVAIGGLVVMGGAAWAGAREAEDAPAVTAGAAAMTRGAVELASIGPLTFDAEGTLFLGDTYGAAVYAVGLEEARATNTTPIDVENIDGRVASLLGVPRGQLVLHDIAVSPVSRAVYLTASRHTDEGRLPIKNRRRAGSTPHLIRVSAEGIEEVPLDDVRFQRADIRDGREGEVDRGGTDRRAWNILEMSVVDGTLYVSGISNEEWSAKLRRLPYPFNGHAQSDGIRIFHTAHGRYETGAPARVFVPYEHDGEWRVFAGFSCTPLVDFSVAEMDEAERVNGKTIAELGAGNHVLDMIGVRYEGETYFFLANHLHDFMRFARSDFDGARRLDRPMGRAGIDRTPMKDFDGVVRLASDRDERIVMLQGDDDHGFRLRTERVADMVR